jgi:hypothetical protein
MEVLDTITFDGNSPVVQAPMWGIDSPYQWQEAIWAACWKRGAMVAVRTCNESGKSSIVVPMLAASFASAFPSAQVVITSASDRQLKKQMEPNLKALFYNKPKWEILANEIKGPSIDGLPPSSIIWFATKGGDMFEGFHVKQFLDDQKRVRYSPLLIIVDEAKSVKKDIFTAIERCNPTIQLIISTCGEDSGDFYDACMNEGGLWTTSYEYQGKTIDFEIPWTMCPHLMKGTSYKRKRAMLDEKGPNDPDVMSILLAKFFRGGSRMVFDESDLSAVGDCSSGMIRAVPDGGRKAFCDFSGGGDELTFGMRIGNLIKPLTCWHNDQTTPPSKTADKYIALFIANGLQAKEIYGDNGGLGALIINELGNKGWNINRINANIQPIYKDGFVDRYSEKHWNLKLHIQNRSIILPNDLLLMNQMRLRRYLRQNSDENKIRMEPKEQARKQRGEKSPDRLDTIVELVDGLDVADTKRNNVYSSLRCGSIQDTMKQADEEMNGAATDMLASDW